MAFPFVDLTLCFLFLMLRKFKPLYRSLIIDDDRCLRRRMMFVGCRHLLDAEGCLGLVLCWSRTHGAEWSLAVVFGLTGTQVSVYLRFGMRILVAILKADPKSEVRMPDAAEIALFKEAITAKHSLLVDCYCMVDGLKLYLQQSGDSIIQSRFYNGWKHDHFVTNIFAFAPNGSIIACTLNAPGTWHDSTLAHWGSMYSKLQKCWEEHHGKVLMDSAFASNMYKFIIQSSQNVPITEGRQAMLLGQQAMSCRQATEWGMRGLQGSFPRLKDRIIYEENGERAIILKFITLLYNYRVQSVGINQILNHFMPSLSKDAIYLLGV